MRSKLALLLISAAVVLAAAPAASAGRLKECRLEKKVCLAVTRAARRVGRSQCLKELHEALGWCYLTEAQAAQQCDAEAAVACLAGTGADRRQCVKGAKSEGKECQRNSAASVRALLRACRQAFSACAESD